MLLYDTLELGSHYIHPTTDHLRYLRDPINISPRICSDTIASIHHSWSSQMCFFTSSTVLAFLLYFIYFTYHQSQPFLCFSACNIWLLMLDSLYSITPVIRLVCVLVVKEFVPFKYHVIVLANTKCLVLAYLRVIFFYFSWTLNIAIGQTRLGCSVVITAKSVVAVTTAGRRTSSLPFSISWHHCSGWLERITKYCHCHCHSWCIEFRIHVWCLISEQSG